MYSLSAWLLLVNDAYAKELWNVFSGNPPLHAKYGNFNLSRTILIQGRAHCKMVLLKGENQRVLFLNNRMLGTDCEIGTSLHAAMPMGVREELLWCNLYYKDKK
jgi:hypothetical protein